MALQFLVPLITAGVASFGPGATAFLGLKSFGAFAARAALGIALNALSPRPKQESRGYQVNSRGSALGHQIIYGRTRVGGVVVYDGLADEDTGFVWRAVALSGHEIDGYERIYVNDEFLFPSEIDSSNFVSNVTDEDGNRSSRYNGNLAMYLRDGTIGQTPPPFLLSEISSWTNQHNLNEIAYILVRHKFDTDVFPNGIPSYTALVRGKKVYDPRTGTTGWSDNPALCLRDYLTSDYGLGASSNEIDDDLVIAAANKCDEIVTPPFPSSPQKRFTCNGSFVTDRPPVEIIEDLLSSMGGLLWYAQGKWRMKAAGYTTPTLSLDENDLRSQISVKTRHSRRDNFNTVRGTFRGPETNYQFTDYPQVTNSSFVSADGGEESVIDFDLPFTDTSRGARDIARIFLERNRQQLTVNASFGLKAFKCQVGDVIQLTNSRFGWTDKPFEVSSWTFGLTDGNDLQVDMTLREISPSVFDRIDDGVLYERDNTNLPSPFNVPSVGLSLTSELRRVNNQTYGVVIATVDSDPTLVDRFEVEFRKTSASSRGLPWKSAGSSSGQDFEFLITEDGTYDVRARAINTFGVRGPWSTTTAFGVRPFAPTPENVTGFSVNVVGDHMTLSWDAVGDLDLDHYRIRYNQNTSGATYANSVDLVRKVSAPLNSVTVPTLTGTLLIKAVDSLGNESPNATSIVTNVPGLQNLNLVQTLSEEDTTTPFDGTKDGLVATTDGSGNDILIIDGILFFDDASGSFDSGSGDFDTGFGLAEEGSYEYSSTVDLGGVYTCKITSDLEYTILSYEDSFDVADGLFDTRPGEFDGDVDQFAVCNVRNQVSHTNDDPTGTPTWTPYEDFTVKDVSARAFRFRTLLSTKDKTRTPAVSTLGAVVDMPDRIEAEDDLSFTGTLSVNFPTAFYTDSNPALGISIQGLSTGDYYSITNKDNTGFDLNVFDSTGATSTTAMTLDYVARGYGKDAT